FFWVSTQPASDSSLSVPSGPAADAPVRNTRLGWVRGKQTTVLGSTVPVSVFLGIPYAAPPLGPLRFRQPKPALPWNDFRDATSYPKLCVQNLEWLVSYQRILKVHYPKLEVSEDCLYLNIYAPAHADNGSRLPVMVWLPGGAFETGSASLFDGSALAAYEDVLIVTTQYRLGIFGFFNTGDEHARGNWAFMDQIAALTWVQENIKFFGGDPQSVTIFGESAGAISVSSLILSPRTNGLFHKAIMESGVAIIPLKRFSDDKRDKDVLAHICGCEASDSAALLRCLRATPSKELLDINKKTNSFTRVVDGFFFPDEPLDLLIQKTFHSIPSIIGVNNHECGFLLPRTMHVKTSESCLPRQMLNMLVVADWLSCGHDFLQHIPTQYLYLAADQYFYNKHSPIEIRDSFLDLLGDVLFVVPGVVTARYHRGESLSSTRCPAAAGSQPSKASGCRNSCCLMTGPAPPFYAGAPVYFYDFQHPPQCLKDTRPAFVKADHTDEIRFVFGGAFLKSDIVMFEGATKEEKLLSRKMMRYWANFARTGDPNGEGVPLWPAYNQREQYLKLDLNVSMGQKLKEQEVEFWTDIL
ncbi:EST1 carboxylesterase, partial [Crocuta crocuta]